MGFSQGLKERVERRVRCVEDFFQVLGMVEERLKGLRVSQPCLKE